ncbi:MAG: gfo/Idh/MocA family oxidoreductase, partial [Candidatus Sumerlaeota bacterium]|nr:gfo/Idh/MocA family oxidoreductase [Candidatus Sumerlaeota bacterium]
MDSSVNRRAFMKGTALAGASFMIAKSGALAAGKSPNEKLNIAVIGYGHRGKPNVQSIKSENIVAICDVNEKMLADGLKDFPQAKTYTDFRKCLDQKD